MLSGFHGDTPRIFWRRVASGVDNIGGTSWQEIPSAALAAVEGLEPGSTFSLVFDFATPGPDGNPGKPGQPIQILAIDRTTGQSTGTSFVIPSP